MDKRKIKYETNKIIRKLYKTSQPYTSHKFSDDAWENVHELFDVLSNVDGIEYFVYGGGKYHKENESEYKEYNIDIVTIYNTTIIGVVRCHFCGTVENPHDAYDITVGFYENKEIKENENMKKTTIKLTENELKGIIRECANNILKENKNEQIKSFELADEIISCIGSEELCGRLMSRLAGQISWKGVFLALNEIYNTECSNAEE